jgi:hypothetical protein
LTSGRSSKSISSVSGIEVYRMSWPAEVATIQRAQRCMPVGSASLPESNSTGIAKMTWSPSMVISGRAPCQYVSVTSPVTGTVSVPTSAVVTLTMVIAALLVWS